MNKSIAFVIHNSVLFYTIKDIYCYLLHRGFIVDIYVADNVADKNWLSMANHTYRSLVTNSVNVLRTSQYDSKKEYLIAFYPYLPYHFEVTALYKIRYQYGMAKPTWNFKPETLLFDYCLCYGNYDYQYLKEYCRSEIVGNLKYAHLTSECIDLAIRKPNSKNISVLYLPTYGEESSFETIIDDILSLPDYYKISIKLHHGTEFLEEKRKQCLSLKNNVALYGQGDDLEKLLFEADIVISDASSACFDAIYFLKPLILVGHYFGKLFYGEEPITQQLATRYGILHCTDGAMLKDMIVDCLNEKEYVTHIATLRDFFFPIRGEESLIKVEKIIEDFASGAYNGSYRQVKTAITDWLKKSVYAPCISSFE